MLVKLYSPSDKAKFFAKSSNLAGKTNRYNMPYSIDEQLPPRIREEKRRQRTIAAVNKKKTVDKLIMSFEKGKLIVEDMEYQQKIQPPTIHAALKPMVEELSEHLAMDIDQGEIISAEGSFFQGYAAAVRNLEEVQVAYNKVKAINNDARHIMCAFRLPGKDFHYLQDYHNDSEHAGGKIILDGLIHSKMFNQAIFIVRKYEGSHIGNQRFDLITEVATSVITINPFNKVLGENQRFSMQKRTRGRSWASIAAGTTDSTEDK